MQPLDCLSSAVAVARFEARDEAEVLPAGLLAGGQHAADAGDVHRLARKYLDNRRSAVLVIVPEVKKVD
mgnify:CR=1 FL=1